MKAETIVVGLGAAFLAVIGAIYWFTSYEHVGTTMLVVGALAYLLMTGYLFLQTRRLHDSRPEDRDDATVTGSCEAVGYFPAASLWPVALGSGVVVVAIGLVFGPWLVVIGTILVVGAIIGYAVEAQAH